MPEIKIEGTALFSDYQTTGFLPSVDALLDWRNRLVELKSKERRNLERSWYDREIAATDFLLTKHQTK